ncbi:8665_t:CDS:1, partial [Gigaspora rosea]
YESDNNNDHYLDNLTSKTSDQILSTDQTLSDTTDEVVYIPLRILKTINECNTRWGSSLASWKRLKELKDSIKHVLFKLSLETNREAKKDYEILKKWFLKS